MWNFVSSTGDAGRAYRLLGSPRMAFLVRVAEIDELPPGKGKTLDIDGREVTVYNQEGRYVATGTHKSRAADMMTTTCEMPGMHFDMGIGDSPDRLRIGELRYEVHVEDGGIYVLVEEGVSHPGEEPRTKPRTRRRKQRAEE
jgi:nitrite reductase/ring-hydroxylating ferredoxin subunit